MGSSSAIAFSPFLLNYKAHVQQIPDATGKAPQNRRKS
jgi:hypothetical protein